MRDYLNVKPETVRLLVINGGAIAEAEARLAQAYRATVSVLSGSGRAAARLADECTSHSLMTLPNDVGALRAFIRPVQ